MAGKTTPKKVKLNKPVVRRSARANEPKQVIKLGTLATVVLFAAIILAIVFLNRQPKPAAEETVPTSAAPTFIFDAAKGELTGIKITSANDEAVELVRNAEKVWEIKQPAEVEADPALAESAASQVFALRQGNSLEGKASIFGLDKPQYTLALTFAGGIRDILEVGDATPTNSGYYARVNQGAVFITDLSGVDALINLVSFPPYVVTSTVTPAP